MNVLILAQYFPPDLGGSTTRAYNVAKGLLLNGCQVTVVTAFPHYPHGVIPAEYRWLFVKAEWMKGIRVIRTFVLPLKSKGLARRLLQFGSFIVSSLFALPLIGKVDVVWAANPDVFAMIPAVVYSRVKRSPVVLNVDDLSVKDLLDLELIESGSVVHRLAEWFTRLCYRMADAVTPISPGYVQKVSEFGVENSRIHVVKGGVDLDVFAPKSSTPKAKKFRVLYSGAFSIAYDFEQVLMAAKKLRNRDSSVEFVVQGAGELAGQIKSRVKELDLSNVQVIDRVLSREDVAEFLNYSDALVLPLVDFGEPYLGMSSKLYEYQAVGKPVICCAEGQPADYVRKTDSGIVIRPGDYEALAKAVTFLKGSPRDAARMGKNGRTCVENTLSLDVIGRRMREVFESVT